VRWLGAPGDGVRDASEAGRVLAAAREAILGGGGLGVEAERERVMWLMGWEG
jgi:hypothetical protein